MSIRQSLPFRSPISKLLRFFCRSRDKWKAKCKAAKRENKSLKYRLAVMTESRNRWKAEVQNCGRTPGRRTVEAEKQKTTAHHAARPMSARATWRCCGQMTWIVRWPGTNSRWAWWRAPWRWCSARGRDCGVWRRAGDAWRWCDLDVRIASYYSVRLWLLRLGLYQLSRPKIQADDWIWIVDHTMQLGERKCLIIVGCVNRLGRRRAGPQPGGRGTDRLGAGHRVERGGGVSAVQAAAAKTGVPRAIVSDGGPRPAWRDRPVPPEASKHGVVVRHQAQDGLPVETCPGRGRFVAGVCGKSPSLQAAGVAYPAGSVGASAAAEQGAIHERRCAGGLG